MKIIAATGRDTFLVEMSDYEIGRCQGKFKQERPEIGQEFSVEEAYQNLSTLAGSDRSLNEALADLKKTVQAIESFRAASEAIRGIAKKGSK